MTIEGIKKALGKEINANRRALEVARKWGDAEEASACFAYMMAYKHCLRMLCGRER